MTTTPPTAEPEITQEAARAMLAALRVVTRRLDALARETLMSSQDDFDAVVAGYTAITRAEGRAP